MNDFSKEELRDILKSLIEHDDASDNHDKLINKIQSMIDNYCDHPQEERVVYIAHRENCGKCHRTLWEMS